MNDSVYVRALRRAAGVLLACAALVAPLSSSADEESAEGPQFAYALSHELMSPFCPGRSLASCPSDQAAELVQWMVLQEAAGATREEVIAVLEARFGDVIKSAPEPEGWGLAAWALPGATLAAGALLVVLVLRRLVGKPREGEGAVPARVLRPAASTPQPGGDEEELARLLDAEYEASER